MHMLIHVSLDLSESKQEIVILIEIPSINSHQNHSDSNSVNIPASETSFSFW